jgi:two-component system, chemotaxis family, chemotaxis protein CheY
MTETRSLAETRTLIVEDEDFMRAMVRRVLGIVGIEDMCEAVDGSDALSKLETYDADLIVLDVMMQPMNGLQFLKMLRSGLSAAAADTPVIVFTGSNESCVFGTALALDCNAFISKNEDPSEVKERIERILISEQPNAEAKDYMGVVVPSIINDGVPQALDTGDQSTPTGAICVALHQVESGDTLDRDFMTADGFLLFAAGTVLDRTRLDRLGDVSQMVELPQLWIKQS